MSAVRTEADAVGARLGYRPYHAESRYDLRLAPEVAARAAKVREAQGERHALWAIPEAELDACAPLRAENRPRLLTREEAVVSKSKRNREATRKLVEAEFRRAMAALALLRIETDNRRGKVANAHVCDRLGIGLSCWKGRLSRWPHAYRQQWRHALDAKPEPQYPISDEEGDDDAP